MTERLYYRDSFLREFGARVLACEPAPIPSGPAEGRFAVTLDATAFYPTSGGQPHDTGRLGEAAVVEVAERDDTIVHFTDRAVPAGPVRGVVDWERRFDHMQQHTGQHILSAAFVSLFQFATVSFHLGREVSTIDLEARSLVPRHIEEAERLSNQVVFEDRPVTVLYGTAEELAAAGIRKAVDREGLLRALEIAGFDRQPCGGTHVARTGQVGMILLRKLEKLKQFWRLEFVCGFRALRAARLDYATLGEAARRFSCGLPEVPAMAGKLLEERGAQQRAAERILEQLAEHEARLLLAAETVTAAGRTAVRRVAPMVLRLYDDADPAFLRMVAARIVAQPGLQALLATRAGGHVVAAQSAGGHADMGALLRECLASCGGKGGGARDFAQGKVADPARLDELLRLAAARLP